jgi:hypothetical protein
MRVREFFANLEEYSLRLWTTDLFYPNNIDSIFISIFTELGPKHPSVFYREGVIHRYDRDHVRCM